MLTRQIIYQLKKKGVLKPIIKGIYYYSPLEAGPAGSRINEFLIPPALFPRSNYYVGYSTMYNYYGFTEQLFQTFYILNTSLQRKRVMGGVSFKFLKIPERRMYGLKKVRIKDAEVIVSDKERTLVDLVYYPDPVGGLKQAIGIFKTQSMSGHIDKKKLINYATIFPGIATRKRIGFVLEQSGLSKKLIAPLAKSIQGSNTLVTLFGSKLRQGSINNKWKIIRDDAQ